MQINDDGDKCEHCDFVIITKVLILVYFSGSLSHSNGYVEHLAMGPT
jgi:hypothetical protein